MIDLLVDLWGFMTCPHPGIGDRAIHLHAVLSGRERCRGLNFGSNSGMCSIALLISAPPVLNTEHLWGRHLCVPGSEYSDVSIGVSINWL